MKKYLQPIMKRIEKGNLPQAFDLYNKRDVKGGLLPTITTSHTLGQCGVTLLFEYEELQDAGATAD